MRVVAILGDRAEAGWHRRLHAIEHAGAVEIVEVPAADLRRHRFRARSMCGREVIVDLPRDVFLFDGAVLYAEPDLALVLRVEAEIWLRLHPLDAAAALELGYHAGNLHWRVRFDGDDLLVAAETKAADYLARVAPLLDEGRVRHVG
ncbi:urease accessory protein UreE [Rhizobiales bacterium L72]|uniref:Urease accessory protein UreE n=1 Tax=Propylenella binzhouense TaxID=2555902 RepID=A0A964WRS7_9HYPH|nr:urease accessory protein UreE [Propylenella binzhouense]MYZ46233.1 urease accessory protein UreE [Propylenella binzhouense]